MPWVKIHKIFGLASLGLAFAACRMRVNNSSITKFSDAADRHDAFNHS